MEETYLIECAIRKIIDKTMEINNLKEVKQKELGDDSDECFDYSMEVIFNLLDDIKKVREK